MRTVCTLLWFCVLCQLIGYLLELALILVKGLVDCLVFGLVNVMKDVGCLVVVCFKRFIACFVNKQRFSTYRSLRRAGRDGYV